MNICTFIGHLGRDCEVGETPQGTSVCSFSLAVKYGFGDNQGTNWIQCSLFGKRADGKLPEYLRKGTKVGVSGELRVHEYDDKDNARRVSIGLFVNTLDLLDTKASEPQEDFPNDDMPF